MDANRRETAILLVEQGRPLERLDQYLCERLAPISRSAIQRLIQSGHVRVNGKPVKPTQHPRAGDRIEVEFPAPEPACAQPEELPLDVLFEDDFLLVLNKPPGLVVHPAAGHKEHTLVNALLFHCAGRLSGIGGVARPGIVHRLDKDTSGCLVVAKADAAHAGLAAQFKERTMRKIYHAFVCGTKLPDRGSIHASIARHPTQRKRMAVRDSGGREAWTSFQVLERLPGTLLVEAELHTGRTHQIRVHFEHAGCPLLGDLTYGSRQNRVFVAETGIQAPRQMLHAFRLGFKHPADGKWIECEAPWPLDFKDTAAALRARSGVPTASQSPPLSRPRARRSTAKASRAP